MYLPGRHRVDVGHELYAKGCVDERWQGHLIACYRPKIARDLLAVDRELRDAADIATDFGPGDPLGLQS